MAALSNCYTPLPLLTAPTLHGADGRDSIQDERRCDGRSDRALRRLHTSTSVSSRSSGSCLLELGHTKVLVAVHGPRPVARSMTPAMMGDDTSYDDRGALHCEVRYAPHVGKNGRTTARTAGRSLHEHALDGRNDRDHASTLEETEWSARLRDALRASVPLEKLPKTVLDVHVLVLQGDGSVLAAAVVAASLALADAGIELYDLVPSCEVAVVQVAAGSEGTTARYRCLADPTEDEIVRASGVVTLSMLANTKEVTFWNVTGRLPSATVQDALDLCRDGCYTVHKFMRECLIQSNVTV